MVNIVDIHGVVGRGDVAEVNLALRYHFTEGPDAFDGSRVYHSFVALLDARCGIGCKSGSGGRTDQEQAEQYRGNPTADRPLAFETGDADEYQEECHDDGQDYTQRHYQLFPETDGEEVLLDEL